MLTFRRKLQPTAEVDLSPAETLRHEYKTLTRPQKCRQALVFGFVSLISYLVDHDEPEITALWWLAAETC